MKNQKGFVGIIIIILAAIIIGGGSIWYFNPGNILGSYGYSQTPTTTDTNPSGQTGTSTNNNPTSPSGTVTNDLASYNWAQSVEPEVRVGPSKVRYYYAELGGSGMRLSKLTYLFNNDSQKFYNVNNLGLKVALLDSNGNVVSEEDQKYFSNNVGSLGFGGPILVSSSSFSNNLKVTVPGEYTVRSIFYDTVSNAVINTLSKKISFGYSVPMSLEATKEKIDFIEKPEATVLGSKIKITGKTENSDGFSVSLAYTTKTYLIKSTMLVNVKKGLLSTSEGSVYSNDESISVHKDYYDPTVQNWIVIKFYDGNSNIPYDYIAVKAN